MQSIITSLRARWEEWLDSVGVAPDEQTDAHWQCFKSLVDGALVVLESDDQ
jgi:hypothetical protein